MATHYRKIELQSPADFTYLYANTVALSRRKLDLHLPPSASSDEPDPMRERVRELVDEFITRTFSSASASISINGMDSTSTSSTQFPFPTDTLAGPAETIEYEPYDTALAARVTSLYAQLESLTTTVAQLRRDAPKKAARGYADALRKALDEDEELLPPEKEEEEEEDENEKEGGDVDVEMADADADQQPKTEEGTQPQPQDRRERRQRRRRHQKLLNPAWKLSIPPISTHETERWESGEMGEVYNDALRTLLRLQGPGTAEDGDRGDKSGRGDSASEEGGGVKALATTVGKAERAGRAAEVVEKM